MSRPFEVQYNPYTSTIEILDSVDCLKSCVKSLTNEVEVLSDSMKRINLA